MTTPPHRYPISTLWKDYLIGGLGLAAVLVLLAGGSPNSSLNWVFLGLAVFFLGVLLHAAWRQSQRLAIDDRGLRLTGWRRAEIAWRDLDGLTLRFYGTRSLMGKLKSGLLVLKLRAGRKRIALDSDLIGFAEILARAAASAKARQLPLDEYTQFNLDTALAETRA